MKLCKYCNSTFRDSATSCAKCGSSDLVSICNNCGAVVSTGFCAQCGVRAGEQAKVCPTCGKRFFSASCPDCGWNPSKQPSPQYHSYTPSARPAPVKKKTSVWIVLLWIFFLPIMGCIAICKSPKLSAKVKIILVSVIAALTVFFGVAGNENDASAPSEAAVSSLPASPSDKATPEPIAAASGVEGDPVVSPSVEATPEPVMAYIDARSLNMRAAASKDSEIIQEYDGGQAVEIIGEEGEWYKVSVAGVVGYMVKDYISLGAAPEQTETPLREIRHKSDPTPDPVPVSVPVPEPAAREIPHSENYHGHVYATPNGKSYHYEADCGGENSKEITWDDVSRRGLDPCGTCVLK